MNPVPEGKGDQEAGEDREVELIQELVQLVGRQICQEHNSSAVAGATQYLFLYLS